MKMISLEALVYVVEQVFHCGGEYTEVVNTILQKCFLNFTYHVATGVAVD
jgi:hypothetical protein